MRCRLDTVQEKLDEIYAEQSRLLLATIEGQKVLLADVHYKATESFGKVA